MASGFIRQKKLKSGQSRYEVVVNIGPDPLTGKRRQRTKLFERKRDAQTHLNKWVVALNEGTAVDRSKQTVADILRYFLETDCHHVKPHTLECYERTVRVHLIPALGNIPVQKLTPAMLQEFYSDKINAGTGDRVMQLCHQRLSQALKLAVRLGLVARNVCTAVRVPKRESMPKAIWTEDEMRRFERAGRASCYGPIWTVATATGMRRGELLGLTWTAVDLANATIYVKQSVGPEHGRPTIHTPKTPTSHRAVPVHPFVIEQLRQHKKRQSERRLAAGAAWGDNDLVFCSEMGTPIWPDNLRRDFLRWVKRAGVPNVSIHGIRHSFISHALARGESVKLVAEIVGQKDAAVTLNIYAHTLPGHAHALATRSGESLFTDNLVTADEAARG